MALLYQHCKLSVISLINGIFTYIGVIFEAKVDNIPYMEHIRIVYLQYATVLTEIQERGLMISHS